MYYVFTICKYNSDGDSDSLTTVKSIVTQSTSTKTYHILNTMHKI